MIDPFSNLPRNHYGAILADPPWPFRTYSRDDAVPARGEQPALNITKIILALLYMLLFITVTGGGFFFAVLWFLFF